MIHQDRRRLLRCRVVDLLAVIVVCAATTYATCTHAQTASAAKTTVEFPPELVEWTLAPGNPVFTGAGPGHWDAKIRERGWILHEGDAYHLWYTGYDGTTAGIKLLGYATSPDGRQWTRYPGNPLVRDHWVEDMMVVKRGETYYMFAEGLHDHAQLLTSKDLVHWERQGTLDIRYTSGKPLTAGPFGTPTAWLEDDTWHLFYERADQGIWLARCNKADNELPRTWTNVQDEPVIGLGPGAYDKTMVALNQIVKLRGAYYAFYHGTGDAKSPRTWTTDVAGSPDLVHWTKYDRNPIVPGNRSSGIVVPDGRGFRLYTMHEQVELFVPRGK